MGTTFGRDGHTRGLHTRRLEHGALDLGHDRTERSLSVSVSRQPTRHPFRRRIRIRSPSESETNHGESGGYDRPKKSRRLQQESQPWQLHLGEDGLCTGFRDMVFHDFRPTPYPATAKSDKEHFAGRSVGRDTRIRRPIDLWSNETVTTRLSVPLAYASFFP
jgi:hypothetical protein